MDVNVSKKYLPISTEEAECLFDTILKHNPEAAFDFCLESCEKSSGLLIELITQRIHNGSCDEEILNSLEVIEKCVKHIGGPYIDGIGRFKLLNEFTRLVSPSYLGDKTSEQVKLRCIELLSTWANEFPEKAKIKETYNMLKKYVNKEKITCTNPEPEKSFPVYDEIKITVDRDNSSNDSDSDDDDSTSPNGKQVYDKKINPMLKPGDSKPLADFLYNEGIRLYDIGKYHNSIEIWSKFVDMKKRLCNENDHIDISRTLNSIGTSYAALSNFTQALHYFLESWQMLKRLKNNKDHKELSWSLGNIGACYENLNDFEKQREFLQMSFEMRQRIDNNKDHPETALALYGLATAYSNLKNYEKCLELNIKCLEMRERVYNKQDHPEVAWSLMNIGVCYEYMKKFELALKYSTKSLEMRQRLYRNRDNVDTASSLNNVGLEYHELGNYNTSLHYLLKSLEMRKRIFHNSDHPDLISTIKNIKIVYKKFNDQINADKYQKLADDMSLRLKKKQQLPINKFIYELD